MAFISTALRAMFSQRQQLAARRPLLLQTIARFTNDNNPPSCQLFVGGLSWGTDDEGLRDAFSSFGEVIDARVITDRETGRSRGFGFVRFTSVAEAEAAAEQMNGRSLGGRNVRVNFATEKPPMGGMGRFGSDGFRSSPGGDFGNGSFGDGGMDRAGGGGDGGFGYNQSSSGGDFGDRSYDDNSPRGSY
eukprot:c17097_g1_i1 orf=426-992(-)